MRDVFIPIFQTKNLETLNYFLEKAHSKLWNRESKRSLHKLYQHLNKPREHPCLLFLVVVNNNT